MSTFIPTTFNRLSRDNTAALYENEAIVLSRTGTLPFNPDEGNPDLTGYPEFWDTTGGYQDQTGNQLTIVRESVEPSEYQIALEMNSGDYKVHEDRVDETYYYSALGIKYDAISFDVINGIYTEVERTEAILGTNPQGSFETIVERLDYMDETGSDPRIFTHNHDGTNSLQLYHAGLAAIGENDHHNRQHAIDSTDDHTFPLPENKVQYDATNGHVHDGNSASLGWSHFHNNDFSPDETADGTRTEFTTQFPFMYDGTTPLMLCFVSGVAQTPGTHFIRKDSTTYEFTFTPLAGANIIHFYAANEI